MKHLAIFKGREAELILTGEKTVEVRFSKGKTAPFGQISSGDLVYIKPVGKDIIGQFRVQKVIFFDGIEVEDLEEMRLKYGADVVAGAKYATLIFIGSSNRFITSPVKITKKGNRGWVVLN